MTEELLRNILDRLDEGVHIVDLKGMTLFYNQAMGRIEGLNPDDVVGKSLLTHFPSLSQETSTLWQVLNNGNPVREMSQTYLNPRGEKIIASNESFPLLVNHELVGAIEVSRDLSKVARLTEQVAQLQSELHPPLKAGIKRPKQYFTFDDIHTQSDIMVNALERAQKAAGTDASVLIIGETGTGKEMVAQSIHMASHRSRGPFVAQNCAALPESLLEGIIFGTVRGSFTGAVDRPGLLEQAQGGTLLLDELDSMGLSLQAKLLRVLQDGQVRRLGDIKERSIDVRFLATMNKSPDDCVQEGRLRPDLYYRLNVVDVVLPPLRERSGDIDLLVPYFMNEFARGYRKTVPRLEPRIMDIFHAHDWAGNVRELAHVIEGGLVVGAEEFGINDLPGYLQKLAGSENNVGTVNNVGTLPMLVKQLEIGLITKALQESEGNITQASRKLGISRQLLQYKMRQKISP